MNIVIIGGGGHAKSVLVAMMGGPLMPVGIVDDRKQIGSPIGSIEGVSIISMYEATKCEHAFVAIGDNIKRECYSKCAFEYVNVVHESADAPTPTEVGIFYGANSYVGLDTKVGKFCIINTGAILEHNSELGDFSHLCPGVVTGGRVKIGHHTTIGLGAMIRDGVTIGNNCVIGMGSVVVEDVPDNVMAYGNPCKFVRFIT